ncbi:MAG: hypothetical protein JSV61_05405 [Anaerolineales bacterium]|nr:MAG: hypothetical protein JSV61_05405 [Anaerolineales bacterium]
MAYTIIIHIQNTDPVVGEVEELPSASDTLIAVQNPRLRDGKDLPYIEDNVLSVLWPVDKINFIEVLSTRDEEEIIGFVRE